MNDICIIGVYFGVFNNYFPLWLKSCKYNPKIDFLIYTDSTIRTEVPTNVFIHYMNIDKFRSLASKKIGVEINLKRPYKCCDLKPMYGLIFEDDIKQYDYWGECDFDLLWGDLFFFLDKYNYKKYDKFLSLGHLSLYRNTPQNNRTFMLPGDHKKGGYTRVLTNEKNFAFDEEKGISQIYLSNKLPFFYKRIFADITPIHKRFTLSPFNSLGKVSKNYKKQIFYWDNGKVFRDYFYNGKLFSEEFMYIHFRGRGNFTPSEEVLWSQSFYVTGDGFFLKKEKTTEIIVNNYNRCESSIRESLEYWKVILVLNWGRICRFLNKFFYEAF